MFSFSAIIDKFCFLILFNFRLLIVFERQTIVLVSFRCMRAECHLLVELRSHMFSTERICLADRGSEGNFQRYK